MSTARHGTGLHHRICHVLGGRFRLDYSALHSVVLPQVVAYNAAAAPSTMASVRRCLGDDLPEGDHAAEGDRVTRGDVADAVADYAEALGAPTRLRDLGVDRRDLPDVAEAVVAGAPDNPADLSVDGIRRLLEAAWAGASPVPNPSSPDITPAEQP